LFNEKGQEVATVVALPFDLDTTQVCISMVSGIESGGCTYWETQKEGYDYLEKMFMQHEAEKAIREKKP
jgi:murein L,D-transpeptidase YafK